MGDITTFMTWFVQQVANIFTSIFNILNGITFANTSILKVIVNIMILSALLPIILTIPKTLVNQSFSEKKPRKEKEKNDNKSK